MVSESPDTKITIEAPVRAPSSVPVDDAVLPFEVAELDLRGRLTRLGPALDDILTKHDYPAPVGKLLGEAIVLATLLGSALKFDGRFILQTQTDGPVSFLIVDFQVNVDDGADIIIILVQAAHYDTGHALIPLPIR